MPLTAKKNETTEPAKKARSRITVTFAGVLLAIWIVLRIWSLGTFSASPSDTGTVEQPPSPTNATIAKETKMSYIILSKSKLKVAQL